MLSREKFIKMSLHMNMFFLRLIREHLYFIGTNLSDVNTGLIEKTNIFRMSFDHLLEETVILADGALDSDDLYSKDIVTPYTLDVEEITAKLTGVSINTNITKKQYTLTNDPDFIYNEEMELRVKNLNYRIMNLLEEVLEYKEVFLEMVLDCEVYISLYPELLKHTVEEEKLYLKHLHSLCKREMPQMDPKRILEFWNHIMMDHGEFIDGMLDPTEENLKKLAREFICIFERLVEESKRNARRQLVQRSFNATNSMRIYKETAVKGLINCGIKSIIPPLLADHVLREAYHYLRLLENIKC